MSTNQELPRQEFPPNRGDLFSPSVDPSTDPSAQAGATVTTPSPEELYVQEVQSMARAHLDQQVAEKQGDMIRRVEAKSWGASQRIDFYEAVRKDSWRDSSSQVSNLLVELQPTDKQNKADDVFDRVIKLVDLDKNGSAPATGHDNTSFTAGRYVDADLEALTHDGAPELQAPEALAKAEKTIALLVNHGLYKLGRWGNGNQLTTALSLMESYAQRVPGFDIDKAGIEEAGLELVRLKAALRADSETKPNYPYAKPERSTYFQNIDEGLQQVATALAHHAWNTQPELPVTLSSEQ